MAAASNAVQAFPMPATRSVDATVTVFTWALWNQNVQVCGMTMYMQCLCIHAMYTVHCTGHVTFNDVIAMIATCTYVTISIAKPKVDLYCHLYEIS